MTNSIISFIIAALSGMGVGGGGLFVIYLSLFTTIPQLICQGINLLFFIFSASSSTLTNIKTLTITWKRIGIMASFGVAGSVGGTLIAGAVNGDVLQKIFGAMLIISGAISLFKLIPDFKKKK